MSPYNHGGDTNVFRVYSDGHLAGNGTGGVSNVYGLRSVINLRADTKFTGTGSETDPFIVV